MNVLYRVEFQAAPRYGHEMDDTLAFEKAVEDGWLVPAYEETDRVCTFGCDEVHYPYPKITPITEPPCLCAEAQSDPHDFTLGHTQLTGQHKGSVL